MTDKFLQILLEYWPVIVAAVSGFLVSFFLYLKAKMKAKTAQLELQQENVKLEQIIAAGSYVVCSNCGEKIFLKNAKIYTGGSDDEK